MCQVGVRRLQTLDILLKPCEKKVDALGFTLRMKLMENKNSENNRVGYFSPHSLPSLCFIISSKTKHNANRQPPGRPAVVAKDAPGRHLLGEAILKQ